MTAISAKKRPARIVAIDDDPLLLQLLVNFYANQHVKLFTAEDGEAGLALIRVHKPDTVILDNVLPDHEGLQLLERIREIDNRLPVLLITAQGTSHTAIEAMKKCAFDYLPKPLDLTVLSQRVSQAIEACELMRQAVVSTDVPSDAMTELMVGRSSAIQQVYKSIGRISIQPDVPVLLVGESGTGKELVARAVHRYSSQADGPFAVVNCGDFAAPWLESELFGHEANTIPGATLARQGKLEEAAGGVLLVEEVCELPLSLQRKLFRYLRDHEFERFGSSQVLRSNARVIASSSVRLEPLVAQGRFRADLYYLLASFTIELPPLRDRPEDIPVLVDYFVKRHCGIGPALNREVPRVSPEALVLLQNYAWPGNVDELQSVLRRALIETKGTVIASDFLSSVLNAAPKALQVKRSPEIDANQATDWTRFVSQQIETGGIELYDHAREEMERHVLARVMERTQGNQAQAARILGITRGSLRKKLQQLSIGIASVARTGEGPDDPDAES